MLPSRLSINARAFINLIVQTSTRDKNILIERFYNNKSMDEVAEQFGLTKPRIQQIEDELIKRIEHTFEYINL